MDLETFDVPFPEYFREAVERAWGKELDKEELDAAIFIYAASGLLRDPKGYWEKRGENK